METLNLTDTPGRTQIFKQAVLNNLDYWQIWLGPDLSDIAALDRERLNIVRAISFALGLEGLGWLSARQLIETFSPYMERRGHWEMWRQLLQRAVIVAQRVGDVSGEANLSTLFARLLRRQSRFRESVTYYRRSIQLSRQIGDRFGEARACTNLGFYYIEQGYWKRTEVLCCHALTIFEHLGNDHGCAHTENHLGFLYIQQGLWNKAEHHLERACVIWQKMGDDHGLMLGYMNLGVLYIETRNLEKALTFSQKALDQAKTAGEELTTGTIDMNIGNIFRLNGEPVQAASYYGQARTIFKSFANILGLTQLLDNWGLLYITQQKWPEAVQHLERAVEAWRKLDNQYSEIRAMTYLVEYELARGDLQQAAVRLRQVETQLSKYDPAGRYRHLHRQVDAFRRSLPDT